MKEHFDAVELEFCVFDNVNIITASECGSHVCYYDYVCDKDVCKRQQTPV